MPSGADGKHYRSYGQAARFGGAEDKSAKPEDQSQDEPMGEQKGGKVVAIKHSGDKESGPKPPFHVKHEDGHVEGPMNSKEELMDHLGQHFGGDEEQEQENPEQGDMSDGSDEALKTLLG